jgi:bifunctional aspartokinase / homoserine dehydrogenase 1
MRFWTFPVRARKFKRELLTVFSIIRYTILVQLTLNPSCTYSARDFSRLLFHFEKGVRRMSTLVMKFGGSSVGTTTGLTQVLSIVLTEQERWKRLLLVVSALEGVTDALIEAAHLAQLSNRRGYRRIVATLRTRHLALIEHLPLGPTERAALQADIDRLLYDMLDTCQSLADDAKRDESESVDAVVGVGERLAARIVAALLRQNSLRGVAIDATDLIVTDNVYGNATINIPVTRSRIAERMMPMLDRSIIPVITGFIGATVAGKPTTLGRGGSDYTASVLGLCCDADEVWIWTDVDGMMTADPREVGDARVISALSYDEVAELSCFGARILHPRMVAPLREQKIPLRVRNVFKPQQQGTLINEQGEKKGSAIKAVTSIAGLGLIAEHSGPLADISQMVDTTLFTTTGSHADVMISSQSSIKSFLCFVIPTTAGPDALHTLKLALEEKLEARGDSPEWLTRPVSVVTAIGSKLDELHAVTASVYQALNGVRILALAQGPSHCSLSFVTEPHDAEKSLLQIHALILSNG